MRDETNGNSDTPDAQARLQARLDERSAIIDGALDGIIVIDSEGTVREFNKAAEAMFGYARQEAIGAQIVELIIPDHHRTHHEVGFQRYVNGDGTAKMIGNRIETEARRKCGELFPVELTIIETAGTGRPVFAGYLRDLTDRRAMEAEVAQQRERISQAEKLGSMGSLLANVAHELNNPLSVVIGRAELLREQQLEDPVKRHTERILTAANRCAGIVRTFLAAVRQKPPQRSLFPAARPLSTALELMEHAVESEGIELDVDIADDLTSLCGDEGQVSQVLANLLTNAQQALSAIPPPRKIRVVARHNDADGSTVFSVSDNGPGVSEDLHARIFEPFFTTKPEGAGTGVGLAIAHNIATAHDGSLSVESDPSLGGACFRMRLPAATDVGDTPAKSTFVVTPDAPVRILVVDDNAECASTIAELLTAEGVSTDIADSGAAAIVRLERGTYDMILSDLRMPDMSGPDLFRYASERWPSIEHRFGFITGDSLNAVAAAFLDDVGAPVAEKPITRDGIADLVARLHRRIASR